MSLASKILLAMSTNAWLRERATRTAFVRRSVSAFMPGERLEDAMIAAAAQEAKGVATIFTKLGENLTRVEDAENVTRHYLEVLDQVQAAGLRAHISVKPTQLGLDIDPEAALANLNRLARATGHARSYMWIDMEGSAYTDATIDPPRNPARPIGPKKYPTRIGAKIPRIAGPISSFCAYRAREEAVVSITTQNSIPLSGRWTRRPRSTACSPSMQMQAPSCTSMPKASQDGSTSERPMSARHRRPS